MSFPISITWSGGAPPVAGFQQMAAAAQKLDSALSTSAGNFDKFGSTISQLESPLSSVGSSMGELSGNMQGLDSSLGSSASAMGEFAGSTEQLNGAIGETGGFITDASGSMDQFGSSASEAGGAATEFGTATTDAGTGVTELGTASSDTGGFVTELGTATGETNTVLGDTNTVLSETAPIMADTATSTGDLAQGFTDLAPPAEQSNAVIGDSVSILEGAGTAADDTALSTEGLGGAFSGLGTEIEPVNGGLTETNTLMGDVGGATNDTNTATGSLSGSMTTLGTGIGAVTGSALTLYSAFTNVRDAQAAVEKAQIKVIDANRKAETSYNTLNRAINKITADTENQISGQGRLAAAQAKLNALWDQGIRSGPQFAAALAELRAAQEGLTSSTTKGNEIIAKLGPNIAAVESTSRKAAASSLNLTRANEGLVESFLGIAGSVIAGVSGLTQIATQAGNVGKAFAPIKGILTGVGSALSGSLVPALGAIAVPAAAAGAAIAAFVGAVTLIRARMGDVDAFGQKIGEVFPAMKGFLDEGRQAFINLSDGVNTAISLVLGGFDSLTGGVLGAQKAWDGWTGVLAKGTGEMGLAGNAANLMTLAFAKSGDVLQVGAGKFKIVNGEMQRLNGSVLAAAGTWDILGDGTGRYLKQAEPVPEVQKKTAEATNQMSEATKKAAEELAKVGTATEEANAKIQFYAQGTKMAELINASFALGIAETKVALIDENAELAKGAGALLEHGNQMANGSLQALAYKQGILEAGEALVKKVQALEQAKGAYDATNALMQEGTILTVEFASGMQKTATAIQDEALELVNLAGQLAAYNDEATRAAAVNNELMSGFLKQKKALIDLALEYAHTIGEIAALRQELGNSAAAQIRFNAGMAEGKKSALEFLVGIQQAKGEAIGFHQEMVKAAEGISGALADMSQQSSEQLQRFIQVVAGVPSAFEKVADGMGKFTQKMVDALGKAAKDGSNAFMENIAKMETELGQIFKEPLKRDIQLAVDVDKAKRDVATLLGALGAAIAAQPLTAEFDNSRVLDAIRMIEQSYAGLPASSKAAFAPLQASLNQLKAWDPGTGIRGLAPIMANILSSAEGLGGPLQGLITSFGDMANMGTATAAELEAVRQAFANVGLTLNTTTGEITDATGKIVGSFGALGPAAKGAAGQTVTALDTLGPAGSKARTTLAFELVGLEFLMNRMAQEVKQSAIEVSTAFANMATNSSASMNRMASGFIIIITASSRLATDSQKMATTVSGSFSNMASNSISSMNRMASGFQIIIAAFPRLTSEANRTNSAVSSAMSAMASRASSFASAMTSSMNRAGSAMASATSKAKALQSAINALKSKTITITTVYVTIRRTIFAAAGGSFVQSNPGKVGPLSVSEFGQKELVTVTPLQGPGRQPVKGLGDILGKETEKKGRRAVAEDMEKGPEKKKEVVMMRETPIVIQVDGREIARVVNKRIFEESDALV